MSQSLGFTNIYILALTETWTCATSVLRVNSRLTKIVLLFYFGHKVKPRRRRFAKSVLKHHYYIFGQR